MKLLSTSRQMGIGACFEVTLPLEKLDFLVVPNPAS